MTRAEELPRAAQAKISLGDLEPVMFLFHGSKALGSNCACRAAIHQQALTAGCPASNPAAQLVQLRKPETLGMLDNHYRGVGNIYADFDHCRRNENAQFAVAE